MAVWWLALDTNHTSYMEMKHRKLIAQGWSALGNLSTLYPLVQNNNYGLFEQVIQELARQAYGTNSNEVSRAPLVMWNLLKIQANDLIVGIEGTAVKGVSQINQNGGESYRYDDSGAYEYAQTIGFPVEWIDWNPKIFCNFTPTAPLRLLGIKGVENDRQRVIEVWDAYRNTKLCYSVIDSVINTIRHRISLHSVPTLNIGTLVGSCFPVGKNLIVPISIKPTSQEIFENDLKILLDILKCLGTQITLILASGGTLVLPEWFKTACQQLNIRVVILQDDEQRVEPLMEEILREISQE